MDFDFNCQKKCCRFWLKNNSCLNNLSLNHKNQKHLNKKRPSEGPNSHKSMIIIGQSLMLKVWKIVWVLDSISIFSDDFFDTDCVTHPVEMICEIILWFTICCGHGTLNYWIHRLINYSFHRLCHKTAPMPIHLYVFIAFGMGLVVHRRVHQAHNFGKDKWIGQILQKTNVLNGHGSSFVTQSV